MEARVAEQFAASTRGHVLTVFRDDGLYRHLSFTDVPGVSAWAWTVVTWPGGLTIDGWHTFTFTGHGDLLARFRATRRDGGPDPAAWAQAAVAGETRGYSPDVLTAWVQRETARYEAQCPGLGAAAGNAFAGLNAPATVHDARARLDDFFYEPGVGNGESFRFDRHQAELHDWSESFVWACHALAAVMTAYDQAAAAEDIVWVTGATGTPRS